MKVLTPDERLYPNPLYSMDNINSNNININNAVEKRNTQDEPNPNKLWGAERWFSDEIEAEERWKNKSVNW